jgi:hypothetical protein
MPTTTTTATATNVDAFVPEYSTIARSVSATTTARGSRTISDVEKKSTPIPVDNVLAKSNKYKKLLLLIFFCISQFIEAVNLCALFTSIVDIAPILHLDDSDAVWLLSAYQLTFASFLLLSGRVADVYNPSECFTFWNEIESR